MEPYGPVARGRYFVTSLAATDLIDPHSAITGSVPELRPTRHWYLPLDRWEPALREWIAVGHKHGREHDAVEHDVVLAYEVDNACFRVFPPCFPTVGHQLLGIRYVSDGSVEPHIENLPTRHWYLPLDRWEPALREWILEGHKEWKSNVYGQCKSWLDMAVHDVLGRHSFGTRLQCDRHSVFVAAAESLKVHLFSFTRLYQSF